MENTQVTEFQGDALDDKSYIFGDEDFRIIV